MTTPKEYTKEVEEAVKELREEIIEISRSIHQNPELGLSEYRARDLLVSKITAFGFHVTTPVAGLETAFLARCDGEKPGPVIAFLAEYDALPGLGHACGHNVIAASSFGAAAALREIVQETGGSILLVGTPDEEAVSENSKGGKVVMAGKGVFDDIDAALMMHPTGGPHAVWRYSFPLKDFTVSFSGKPAHYTKPEEGINALESLLLFINMANALKRSWDPDILLAYTITDGGGPSAITVPEHAKAHFTLKTFNQPTLDSTFRSLETCLESVSKLTHAKGAIEALDEYQSTIPNLHLCASLYRNMKALGCDVENPVDSQRILERMRNPGISTDFGDVSRLLPAIHGYCSLGPSSLVAHTPDFAEAAGGRPGNKAAVLSAKVMALTALDLLADPFFAQAVRDEFAQYAKENFLRVPGLPPDYPPFPKDMQEIYAPS